MIEAWLDLHVHTCYSDGLLTPEEVVKQAKKVGLSGVGIVDHDTIAGIPEAQAAGDALGVTIVPGAELSSQHSGRDIHILGYYMQADHPRLIEYLERFRKERYKRAERMVGHLNQLGVNISMAEVEAKASRHSIGRPHIAEILTEKGYVETFQEAFHRYIGYGGKAYEEKYRISPQQAIALIAEVGGLSFLAHPGSMIDDKLILELIKAGLDGIEIVHPKLSDSRTRFLQRVAQNHGLLVSGGSDCHGGRNGMLTIGKYKVPINVIDEMKEAVALRRR